MEKTCAITKIVNHLAKKWTLHVLRELHEKKIRRFTELLFDMQTISPRTLSARLKELEQLGLILKTKYNELPPRVEYSLTPKGRDLIKCFRYLDGWAKKHLSS